MSALIVAPLALLAVVFALSLARVAGRPAPGIDYDAPDYRARRALIEDQEADCE